MGNSYKSVLELHKDLAGSGDFTSTLEKDIKGRQVATAIFSVRNKLGITQKQLAHKMGLSQSAISKFESSPDEKITVGELLKFSRALGISTELVIYDKKMTAVDKVKYHWFKIKAELDGLRAMSDGDKAMEKGVSKFTEEAFVNITSGLLKCLERFKGQKDLSGPSGLRISGVTSSEPQGSPKQLV